MTSQYRFDPGKSRFTVQAFATGMLSFLGHNPTFAIHDFNGGVSFEDDMIAKMRVELTINASSLAVTGNVKPGDRKEIEDRMRSEVLRISTFPQISFQGNSASTEKIKDGYYRVNVDGQLKMHNVSKPHLMEVELRMFSDGIRLQGGTGLLMSDFGIPPVTVLAGAIQLKNELALTFDLAARQGVS
jgi:polyisoprenoid-binding protein YceI